MKLISKIEYDYEEYLKIWEFPYINKIKLKNIKQISNKTPNPLNPGYFPYSFDQFKTNYYKIKRILNENKKALI